MLEFNLDFRFRSDYGRVELKNAIRTWQGMCLDETIIVGAKKRGRESLLIVSFASVAHHSH
jgi:hypothetical protein